MRTMATALKRSFSVTNGFDLLQFTNIQVIQGPATVPMAMCSIGRSRQSSTNVSGSFPGGVGNGMLAGPFEVTANQEFSILTKACSIVTLLAGRFVALLYGVVTI